MSDQSAIIGGMGQNNRQRRAAKQRRRVQEQRGRRPAPEAAPGTAAGPDGEAAAAGTATLVLARVLRVLVRGGEPTLDLADFRRCAERHQQAALDGEFTRAVTAVIRGGWTPSDLDEVLRRKGAAPGASRVLEQVAAETDRYPAHLVDARWRAQLDALVARGGTPAAGVSPSWDWCRRAGLDWPEALAPLLAALAVVHTLPVLPTVLPPPGERAQAAQVEGIDAKVLRRVRGLLAKAESTEHDEEADALTAKAQELMTRHSIERAVAESSQPVGVTPLSRRLWLENPYVDAKALLVEVVASANNCRAVQSGWGFVSVVGHATDLDVVELLTTSLLVQATRAMTQAGSHVTRYGTSRTRSFRQSFLVAYAGRIGERLQESATAAETAYSDAARGGALVPVLAARREAVDDAVTSLFPGLVERRITASNPAGYGAGRAAANLARLDVRRAMPSNRG